MIRRAHTICSDKKSLDEEIAYLSDVFQRINGYPIRIIKNCLEKVDRKMKESESCPENGDPTTSSSETSSSEESEEERDNGRYILMPYAGKQGEKIMKNLQRKLPENVRPKIVYKGTKLSSHFPIKDKISKLHSSNLVYYYKSSDPFDEDDYTGETKVRLGKRIGEHCVKKDSSIYKNFTAKGKPPPSESEFSILAKNYPNRLKRRIAESLFAKEKMSNLNVQ